MICVDICIKYYYETMDINNVKNETRMRKLQLSVENETMNRQHMNRNRKIKTSNNSFDIIDCEFKVVN